MTTEHTVLLIEFCILLFFCDKISCDDDDDDAINIRRVSRVPRCALSR